MRVLVTGSRGFVGTRLIPRLEAAGHVVAGFDLDSVDICDPGAVANFVQRFSPEAAAHLAAVAFVPAASEDPNLARRVNVGGTKNLIEALQAHASAARLLLVGSGEQYPALEPGSPPLSEDEPLAPTGPYATTKTAAEELGREAAEKGLDVVAVRAFNHTGPGQALNFVAPNFARQIAEIEAGASPLMRVGNLDSVRDFLHVEDVVDAYLRLLDPKVPAGVYNVASGTGTRIGALLDTVAALARASPQIDRDATRWGPADARVGDAQRLRDATGWAPSHSREEILTELLDYWRERVQEDAP